MAVQSTAQIPTNIVTALQNAAKLTGADFQYLVDTAARESGFRPSVKARTSSATGLFQFIDSTWLQMVKDKGPELGLGDAARHITKTENGRYKVRDPEMLREILNLRKNPEVAAVMAGAFTQFNAETLEGEIGRKPTSGELYIAHFLGAGNGSKLIRASSLNPEMKAADLFPAAARSNKSLFYRRGEAVSVKGLYQNLVRRHSVQRVDLAGLGQAEPSSIPLPQRQGAVTRLSSSLSGDEIKTRALAADEAFALQNMTKAQAGLVPAGQDLFSSIYKADSFKADPVGTPPVVKAGANQVVVAGLDSVARPELALEQASRPGSERGGSVGVWGGVGDGRSRVGAGQNLAEKRGPILDLKNRAQDGLPTGSRGDARGLFTRGGLG